MISLIKLKKLNQKNNKVVQKGGTTEGLKYLETFLNERFKNYQNNISKPMNLEQVVLVFHHTLLGEIFQQDMYGN